MRWAAALVLAFAAGMSSADEMVAVCYNYGCAGEEMVLFSDERLEIVRRMLVATQTPEQERAALALVVGRLYAWAGEQAPIGADRGGNVADEGDHGRMDCIDHSTTTTRFLDMLEERGWLQFHRVMFPERRLRFFVFQHYSAVIEELGPLRDPAHPRPERYVVDSWFRDNGRPAVILPLEDWLAGEGEEE